MNVYLGRVLDRTFRTAVQTILGYLVVANTLGGVDWGTALLAAGLAAVTSLLQGLVDLPTPHNLVGEILGRALRTLGQTALGSVGASVLLTDVPWGAVLSAALLAALVSVGTSILAVPVGPRGTADLVQ